MDNRKDKKDIKNNYEAYKYTRNKKKINKAFFRYIYMGSRY